MTQLNMIVSLEAIMEAFPAARIAVVVAEQLTIAPERSAELDDLIRGREQAARERWGGTELASIPGIAAWRAAYKGFGIKQTRYRSSVERLVKNVLAGRDLARVNGFVDLYNAVSLAHVLPLGADDLDKVTPPLAFRFTRDGDSFVDMAGGEDAEEGSVPKPGEVVYADEAGKVLCRRWNWRQDARSLITSDTRRAVITLQSNGWGEVEAAAADLMGLIDRFCGSASRSAIIDSRQPRVEF